MSEEEKDNKKLILDLYSDIVKVKQRLPTYVDYKEHDISKDMVRHHYGNIETLHQFVRDNYPEYINDHITTQSDVFGSHHEITKKLTSKRYIITTAVASSKPHSGFLDAMDNYSKMKDAQICILPAESITNSFEKSTATFAPEFSDSKYTFISDNVPLNDNLFLCSIQVSAKQIKPITGLSRIGKREGSYIFASPKQFLEMLPSGNQRNKSYAIMTPGACTLPNYGSDVFVSKRLAYIAESDHTIGGIIVEIEDDVHYHFRHFQCEEDGSFVDLGVKYNPDGTIENVRTMAVMGDLHIGGHDDAVVSRFCLMISRLNLEGVVIHDIFNGHSINHHINHNYVKQAIRFEKNRSSLQDELVNGIDYIFQMQRVISKGKMNIPIHVVKSNHDEWLNKYVEGGKYIYDPENHYLAIKLAPALFEDRDILREGYLHHLPYDSEEENWFKSYVNFLQRDEDLFFGGVQLGVHGDLGINGAKGSLNTYEKIYGRCVVGHYHGAAIQRQVFRVGTFTTLDQGYNIGPSAWSHTGALVYENGQVQLLNYINGKFHMD